MNPVSEGSPPYRLHVAPISLAHLFYARDRMPRDAEENLVRLSWRRAFRAASAEDHSTLVRRWTSSHVGIGAGGGATGGRARVAGREL